MATYKIGADPTDDYTTWAGLQAVSPEAAGDTVSFRKGETFRETITVPASGASGNVITYTAHGTGAAPIINGADLVTTWATTSTELSDNFDDNDLTGWNTTYSGGVANQNGRLEVTVDTGGNDFIYKGITSRTEYWMSATINLATVTAWNSGNTIQSCVSLRSSQGVGVGITQTTGVYYWKVYYTTDAGDQSFTTATSLNLATTYNVLLYFKAATGAGNNDGIARVWINGSNIFELTNIDSDTRAAAQAALGGINTHTTVFALLYIDNLSVEVPLGTSVYRATCAWTPTVVVEDTATRLTKSATLAGVNASGMWYADGSNLYVRSSDDANPTTHTISAYRRQYGIDIGANSFITVDGLQFTGHQGNGSSIAIQPPTSTGTFQNYTIQNCHFYHEGGCSIYGVILTSANTRTVQNISILDNTFDEGHWSLESGVEKHFIFLYSGDNADAWRDLTISGNTIYQDILIHPTNDHALTTNGIDISLSGGTNLIEDNEIEGVSHCVHVEGLVASVDLGIIRYNHFHDTADDGIWIDGNCGALKIYYNLIYNTLDNAIDTVRNTAGAMDSVEIYNNTFSNTDNAGIKFAKVSHVTMKNNIFKECAVTDNIENIRWAWWICDDGNSDTTYPTLTSNNNVFYHSSGEKIVIWDLTNGYTEKTLATWKTLSSQDSGSLNSDPLVTSATDFTLQPTSPCINAGTDVGLTEDYAGHVVAAIPDIGAYEHIGAVSGGGGESMSMTMGMGV